MKKRFGIVYSPDDPPAGTPGTTGPTLEQVQQQLREITEKYEKLQGQITNGKLVEPTAFLKARIDAGEVFPKERYAGLQQTLQQAQDKATKATEDLAKVQGEFAEQKALFSNLEERAKTLETTVSEKEKELGTLRPKLKRTSVIMEKFPNLASFEAKSLLPPVEDESKLEEVFGAFAEQLAANGQKAKESFAAGGGSATPGSTTTTTPPAADSAKEHFSKAIAALDSGDRATYDAEYDAYLKASAAKT